MNQFVNSAEDAFRFVSSLAVTPIVLYPGETWMAGTQHDSQIALSKYKTDFDRAMEGGPLRKTNPVSIETLQAAAREFIARLRRRNSRLLLWRIPPTCISIKDHGLRLLKLSLDGLEDTPQRSLSPDIVLSSSALLFCFKHDFGGETLTINGRFEVPPGADRSRFFRWFSIASANSHGIVYDLGYYLKKLARCTCVAKAD
jgi:UDP-MurNAc hydroxylase